jgi:hypothetical protein
LQLTYQMHPAEIQLRDNLMSSSWLDIDDLVAKKHVRVHKDGAEASTEFGRHLAAIQATDYTQGAALHWAVLAAETGGLHLVLQALPAAASYLKTRALFKLDECATLHLAEFPAKALMDISGQLHGPKPVLLTKDMGATTGALNQNQEWAMPGEALEGHFRLTNYAYPA